MIFKNEKKWIPRSLPVLLLLLLTIQKQVPGAEEKVTVKEMIGTVQIRSTQSGAWRSARVGMSLRTGWDVRTLVESNAELLYESGTIIRIGENSLITLSSMQQSGQSAQTSIKVGTGQIWSNVKKLASSQSKFEFETPTAVASIRGTRLGVLVGKGTTAIDVYEGLVMVRNKQSGKELPVVANVRAEVVTGRAEIKSVPFSALTKDVLNKKAIIDPFKADSAKDTSAAKSDSSKTPSDSTAKTDTTGMNGTQSATGALALNISTPQPGAVVTVTPVLVKGKTASGARVNIDGKDMAVGADGSFSGLVEIQPGDNTITIAAQLGNEAVSVPLQVAYHPPLFLNVLNIIDNMEVLSPDLQLDIEVTQGAQWSVNGRSGADRISLSPGRNTVLITATDPWGGKQERTFFVNYRKSEGFNLIVTTPIDGGIVETPMILVSGSTVAGAKVSVNRTAVTVSGSGTFNYQVPIPDEPQEYTFEIVATYGDDEKREVRTVTYKPKRAPLQLTVTSPAAGQIIGQKIVRVTGMSSEGAVVNVNSRRVTVMAKGAFSCDIPVGERDIGTFTIDIQAMRDEEELSKSVDVTIDKASPLINTTIPRLLLTGIGLQAIRNSQLQIQAIDMTPDDQVNVNVNINGAVDNLVMDPGGRDVITLNEGKNDIKITGYDLARNASALVHNSIYYLPGPLQIEALEPSGSPVEIDDLPPFPRNVDNPVIHFKVELDDGIGTVPETIRYCKVISSIGQTVILRDDKSYTFTGDLPLARGTTFITIQAEDIAGNIAVKRIEMRINE